MNKLLIALDYHPTALKVAEAGYELAKANNANAVLLHVISDPTYYSSLDYSPVMGFGGFSNVTGTDASHELKEVAQKYLEKSKQRLGDTTIQTIVKVGAIGETILKAANELKADAIVLGTHSRRGLERILVGSVAEYVLHHSLIPLYIIPTKSLRET